MQYYYYQGKVLKSAPSFPLNNSAFYFGESIFTSFLSVNGKINLLDEHLERITLGVKGFFGESLCTKALKSGIGELLQQNDLKSFCYLRITSFLLEQKIHWVIEGKALEQSGHFPFLERLPCIKVKTVEFLQDLGTEVMSYKVGSLGHKNYLLRKIKQQGLDDYLCSRSEQVFDLSYSNLIYFAGKNVVFSKVNSQILKGTTLKLLKQYLQEDFSLKEAEQIYRDDLYSCDLCLSINAVKGIRSISEINEKKIDTNNHLGDKILKGFQKFYCDKLKEVEG